MKKRGVARLLMALFPLVLLEVALRVAGIGGSIVYVEHPDYGYRPAPHQRFSTMGHRIEILENGFRAPRGTNQLLVVGDSVAYGTAYIRDDETFAAYLGADNGGVNGWGLQNVGKLLEELDCSAYRAIIWVIPSCDVMRPFTTLRAGLISTNRRMWFRTEYLLRFLWYGHLRAVPAANDPSVVPKNWQAVRDAQARLAERGCRLLPVFLPSRDEAAGRETADTPHFQWMLGEADAAGLQPFLAMPGAGSDEFFRDAVHLTTEGNRWLASVIAAELQRRGW